MHDGETEMMLPALRTEPLSTNSGSWSFLSGDLKPSPMRTLAKMREICERYRAQTHTCPAQIALHPKELNKMHRLAIGGVSLGEAGLFVSVPFVADAFVIEKLFVVRGQR